MVLVDFLEASCRRRPQARRAVLQVEVAWLLLVEEEAEQAPEQEHDQEEQGVFLKGTSFQNPSSTSIDFFDRQVVVHAFRVPNPRRPLSILGRGTKYLFCSQTKVSSISKSYFVACAAGLFWILSALTSSKKDALRQVSALRKSVLHMNSAGVQPP